MRRLIVFFPYFVHFDRVLSVVLNLQRLEYYHLLILINTIEAVQIYSKATKSQATLLIFKKLSRSNIPVHFCKKSLWTRYVYKVHLYHNYRDNIHTVWPKWPYFFHLRPQNSRKIFLAIFTSFSPMDNALLTLPLS